MLYITVIRDSAEDEIFNVDALFDSAYDPEWVDNDFSRLVIRDIDKSEVVSGRIIDSPYLGCVSPTMLSGGVKCILLLAFCDMQWDGRNLGKINITSCGNNCMKWIQVISKVKDLHVYLSHLPVFDDNVYFDIVIENNGMHCTSQKDILAMWAEVGY